jgi:hypothetical protein
VGKMIGTRGKTVEIGGGERGRVYRNDWIGVKLGEEYQARVRRVVGCRSEDMEEVGAG